jgi:arginase family enzyme
LGGDCSILIGVAAAVRQAVGPFGLVFIDGHPDYLDGASSPTGEAADMELAILTGHGSWWLHLDLDALDEEALPAVTYPQPGGLDWDNITGLLGALGSHGGLVGVSVADFRPDLDPAGRYAWRTVALLATALGRLILEPLRTVRAPQPSRHEKHDTDHTGVGMRQERRIERSRKAGRNEPNEE